MKEKTEEPSDSKTVKKLFLKLRKKALSVGADAVIVEKRKLKERYRFSVGVASSGTKPLYLVSYQGLLIKTCKDSSGVNAKAAPYNHQGHTVKDIALYTMALEKKITITLPERAKLYHPIISQNNVSLEHGIYGVTIGSSYQQVIASFGDPSIEFNLFADERVIGYGRRHWLHFQADKLVKVSSESSLLSKDILNKVPLLDFFDESQWKISGLISDRSSLSEVKNTLNINSELNKKNQLIVKNSVNTLVLNFDYNKNSHTNEITHTLVGFTLQEINYQKPSQLSNVKTDRQFDALSLASSTLERDEEITWSEYSKTLGKPIGRITVSAKSYINIYNENLAIFIRNSELDSIYLLENIIKQPLNKRPWSIGRFAQGKTLVQLSKYFPNSASIYDNEAEIDTGNYKLSLYFDNDDLGLYEAILKVY